MAFIKVKFTYKIYRKNVKIVCPELDFYNSVYLFLQLIEEVLVYYIYCIH